MGYEPSLGWSGGMMVRKGTLGHSPTGDNLTMFTMKHVLPSALHLALCSSVAVAQPSLPSLPPPVSMHDVPVIGGAMAPRLSTDGDQVWLSWFEPVPGERVPRGKRQVFRPWRFRAASLQSDGAWSEPVTISQSAQFIVNWADFPSLAIGRGGVMLSHWLERAGEGFAYDVILTRSIDGGQTWTRLGKAHDDFTQTEHGFVSYVPMPRGVWAFWLDGREMVGGHDDAHGHGHGAMSIRTGFIGAGISHRAVLDDRVCECCNTGAALTSNGPVIVYRDRDEDETRDISIVRKTDDGWTEPAAVHDDEWVIAGCPVNGPAIVAREETVVVAWFTSPDSNSKVLASYSFDAGATFQPPVVIDDGSDGAMPLGRVSLAFASGSDDVIVGWLDTDEEAHLPGNYDIGGAAFRVRQLSRDGALGEPLTITAMDNSRASGFPQMIRHHDRLIVAWTETSDPSHVRVGHVSLTAIPH